MTDEEAKVNVELVPVVPIKTLHKCVRNILVNEYKLSHKEVEQRVEDYFNGHGFHKLVEDKVGNLLHTKYYSAAAFEERIQKAVDKKVDEIIGQTVRDLVVKRLSESFKS
jgi:hypothetical protein